MKLLIIPLVAGACLVPLCIRAAAPAFAVQQHSNRLEITLEGRPAATYVFNDAKILRPYFANLHAPGGLQVTRTHPPVAGVDATDHDTMHPGVWLAFGDINGQDFWRNKGRIEHVQFLQKPRAAGGQLTFATECRLIAAAGAALGSLTNRCAAIALTNAWLLVWEMTCRAQDRDLVFGDQEEMGLGVRVATGLTERNGGVITSSSGLKTAKDTWGKAHDWCDYSGTVAGQDRGITLMAHPDNFRASWFHNRDYGLMVANPFGREAMKQGAKSSVPVRRGDNFRLIFGAAMHAGVGDSAETRTSWFARFLAEGKK